MSLYTLLKTEPSKWIMPLLPEGTYDAILKAVLKELPDHPQPGDFAKGLIEIADRHHLPPEEIENWLAYKVEWKRFTPDDFERWAQVLEDSIPQVLREQKTKFCHCGHPLQMLNGVLVCAECGELA